MRKLVRDKIPRMMMDDGVDPQVRILSTTELDKALRAKLLEEAQEVIDAETPEAFLEEMADLWEVWYTLMKHHGLLAKDAYEAARDKGFKRGRFTQGFEVEIAEPAPNVRAVLLDTDKVPRLEVFPTGRDDGSLSAKIDRDYGIIAYIQFYVNDDPLPVMPLATQITLRGCDECIVYPPRSFS